MRILAALVAALALVACSKNETPPRTTTSESVTAAKLALSSSAFAEGEGIPRTYTCDGADVSPPVSWKVPPDTAELALLVEDPDAPNGTFVHWVLYGISPDVASLAEGSSAVGTNGTNSFGKKGYGGPCPPKGTRHRYVFTVWALSEKTKLAEGATASQLRDAMPATQVVAQDRLTGVYGR